MEKYEKQIKHFGNIHFVFFFCLLSCILVIFLRFFDKGMLRRWDDSQRYLSDNPSLVCEETANYLVIMCIDLEVEEVSANIYILYI